MCGGFSPRLNVVIMFIFCCWIIHVGEITQGRLFYDTLVLPSLTGLCLFLVSCFVYSDDGEIHRVVIVFLLSFSPLLFFCLCWSLSCIQMTGRFTGYRRSVTLILPPMNRILNGGEK